MNITQITISVHEKRNNPYEYGHYDTEVRLTADLTVADDPVVIIPNLIESARLRVIAECDRWVAQLREEQRAAGLIHSADHQLHWVAMSQSNETLTSNIAEAADFISKLPGDVQNEYRGKLEEATQRAKKRIAQIIQDVDREAHEDEDVEEEELEEENPF